MNRASYIDALIPLVMVLAGAVRDDGPTEVCGALSAIKALPMPEGVDLFDACAIVATAAIDVDKTPSELWGRADKFTAYPDSGDPVENPFAREMALAGHLPGKALDTQDRIAVVGELMNRGMRRDALAEHLSCDPAQATRWMNAVYVRRKREGAAA